MSLPVHNQAPPALIPQGTPLGNVPGMSASQIRTLAALWIDTAQELVGVYGTTEITRGLLATAMAVERRGLDTLVNSAQRIMPLMRDPGDMAFEMEAAQAEYGMGALLEDADAVLSRQLTLPPYEPAPLHRGALPPSHDLLGLAPPLRNQGKRNTCVAFAALAVREQLEIAAGAPQDLDLSEQYVYWWCKQHDRLPDRTGTYLSFGMRCLVETGAPLEALWPYAASQEADVHLAPPPAAASTGDPAFRTLQTQEFSRADLAGMKACLVEGRAIVCSIPVYNSWFKSSASLRWGKITLPLPGEPVREGHAVTLVGYHDDPHAPGGGYFIVRNSWQPWAWAGAWKPGYGYIPYAYIAHHANVIFSAQRMPGATLSVRSRAGDETGPQDRIVWGSPDVWLRREADGGETPQSPLPGRENALYVRVFNRGPACAYRVVVEILQSSEQPYAAPGEAIRAGRIEMPMLWPGETILGPCMWVPAGGPGGLGYVFGVRISSAFL